MSDIRKIEYRFVFILFVVVLFTSCKTKNIANDMDRAKAPKLDNIGFSESLLSLGGDIQPFNHEIKIDTLEDNKYLINLSLYTDFPSLLPKFKFNIKYPRNLATYIWSSKSWSTASFINLPNYSRLQSDYIVLSVLSEDSKNRITMSTYDDFVGRYTQIDVNQESDSMLFTYNFFSSTVPDAEVLEFKVKILVDLREINFSNTIRESSQWRLDNERKKSVSKIDPSLLPAYSVWYPMDRNIPLENVTHYFDSIASMGFRSILFDDAWQNVVKFEVDKDGNWDPSSTTVVKDFMAKSKEKNMKVALWYSQPFIGAHNYVFKKFEGKYLQYLTSSQPVLDIRYPEVRDYLTKMYANIVEDWGIDGIWFDFLNGFYPDEHIIVTEDKGRDFVSVRKALDSLRIYMQSEMLMKNENLSINQSYPSVGPMHTSNTKTINGFLGTTALNEVREKMVNCRLLYGEYSPFMEVMGIHPKDPAVDVAKKFQAILYGSPYISYFSYTLNDDIRETLGFWIKYWKSNYEFLREGEFDVYYPVQKYPLIIAGNETKKIATLYDRQSAIDLGYMNFEMADVINSSNYQFVSIHGKPTGKVDYIVHNYKGLYQTRGTAKFKNDIATFEVPPGGFVRLIIK
jgi:alpha-galactosidase